MKDFIMKNLKLIIIIGLSLLLVALILWAVIISKKNKQSKHKNIAKSTVLKLEEVPQNLKCTYDINFSVINTSSSREIQTILDRKSPIIKLDMSTGKMIVEFLTTPKSLITQQTQDIGRRVGLNSLDDDDDDDDDDSDPLSQQGCSCPTEEIAKNVRRKRVRKGNRGKGPRVPKIMRVVTPSISFQKKNTIQIRQNLREIDILLNGELFHSALLDYVPYMYPGDGIALTNDASSHIIINSLKFRNNVKED
tara:strand:+ start:13965 stop:14714 length:750 start_codon:yes stop_codon:yes gene_type:complete